MVEIIEHTKDGIKKRELTSEEVIEFAKTDKKIRHKKIKEDYLKEPKNTTEDRLLRIEEFLGIDFQ